MECGNATGPEAPPLSKQHFIPSVCRLLFATDVVVSLSGAAQQLCSSEQSPDIPVILSNAVASASSNG
jgi:hypothetical protein